MVNGSELNPLQLYLNYWEIPPAKLGATLDHLQRLNIAEITVFVPWQHFEKDLTHSIYKLLNGAIERKMRMNFVITPELGVHYPFAGVPRDVAMNTETWIRDDKGFEVSCVQPPVMFALPDLGHVESQKRFQAYLEKFQRLMFETLRNRPEEGALFRVWCGGGFFKYHRSVLVDQQRCLEAELPALAKGGGNDKQRFLDRYYSSSEFEEPSRSQAPKWRGIDEEKRNERIYQAALEDGFRDRVAQVCTRRTTQVAFEQIDVVAPEVDPSLVVPTLQSRMPGAAELSALLDAHLARSTRRPVIHWTAASAFQSLSDAEKQFLILRSLIEAAHRGGVVLLDLNAWMKFSSAFRERIRRLGMGMVHDRAGVRPHALLLTDHPWVDQKLSGAFQSKLGTAFQVTRRIEDFARFDKASLFILDRQVFLTRERVQSLLQCLERGAVVAISQKALATYSGSLLLRSGLKDSKTWAYRQGIEAFISHIGRGILVQYACEPSQEESLAFALLRISEWTPPVALSNGGNVPFTELYTPDPMQTGLVMFNASSNPVRASIGWSKSVRIGDYATDWLGRPSPEDPHRLQPQERLDIDLPPWGVVPLKIHEEKAEHGLAVRLEKSTKGVSTQSIRPSH